MSDCFDHAMDAFESGFYGDGSFPPPRKSRTKMQIYDEVIHEKPKAILFRFTRMTGPSIDYWMPKSRLNKTELGYEADVKLVINNMKSALAEMEE